MTKLELAVQQYETKLESLENNLKAEKKNLIEMLNDESCSMISSYTSRIEQLEKEINLTKEFVQTLNFIK